MLFDSYSAASDIVYHNENGILVQPFDCNEYAAETKKLMDNPEKTSELALNAYENVLRFSYEETYKKWEKVFKFYFASAHARSISSARIFTPASIFSGSGT